MEYEGTSSGGTAAPKDAPKDAHDWSRKEDSASNSMIYLTDNRPFQCRERVKKGNAALVILERYLTKS